MTTPKKKTKAKAQPKPVLTIEEQAQAKLPIETDNVIILTDEAKAHDPNFRKHQHAVEPIPLTAEQIRINARLAIYGRPNCQR